MSISDFLKGSAGIAAIAGSGGLAAGLGLAGSLFGQSGGSRLRASRDSAQQAARERFDPSIYQPMHTQGQTMATEGLGRMEDIARERTVASLFRQRPQPMGSSAREIALQQQQSGMARQALAGFEGQLTQADIARRQEGEMMATQAETQMRDTRAQRGSALNNIESMYQAERGARRDKTIGAIAGTVGQLGAAYLMGKAMKPDGVTDGVTDAPLRGVVDDPINPSIGDALGMQQGLEGAEAGLADIFGNLDPLSDDSDITSPFAQAEANISRTFMEKGESYGDQSFDYSGMLDMPEGQQQQSVEEGSSGAERLADSLGVLGTVPAMLSGREIETGIGKGVRNLFGPASEPFIRGGEQIFGTLGNATEGTGYISSEEAMRRNELRDQGVYTGKSFDESSIGQLYNMGKETLGGIGNFAGNVGMRVGETALPAVQAMQNMFTEQQPQQQYSVGDTEEMPEWLRETFETDSTTFDPMSEEVQSTFSGIESEYNLPEGLLRGVMMTETSGRPEFAMDYHYGEGADSTAFGMFGITKPTAMDAGFGVDSLLTEGQSLKDVSWEDQARFAAQYLSALIEREGSLERGLDRYGTGIGSGYNQKVLGQINQ